MGMHDGSSSSQQARGKVTDLHTRGAKGGSAGRCTVDSAKLFSSIFQEPPASLLSHGFLRWRSRSRGMAEGPPTGLCLCFRRRGAFEMAPAAVASGTVWCMGTVRSSQGVGPGCYGSPASAERKHSLKMFLAIRLNSAFSFRFEYSVVVRAIDRWWGAWRCLIDSARVVASPALSEPYSDDNPSSKVLHKQQGRNTTIVTPHQYLNQIPRKVSGEVCTRRLLHCAATRRGPNVTQQTPCSS